MQHSKTHAVRIHAAAAAALLMLLGMFLSIGALSAHAFAPPGTPSTPTETPLPSPASQAQTQTPCESGNTICNPLRYQTLDSLLGAVLDAAIQIGAIVLTIALVWVGFKFVAARGNEEKIRSARTALMWTIIGGLILLGAKAIQVVITSTVQSLQP